MGGIQQIVGDVQVVAVDLERLAPVEPPGRVSVVLDLEYLVGIRQCRIANAHAPEGKMPQRKPTEHPRSSGTRSASHDQNRRTKVRGPFDDYP